VPAPTERSEQLSIVVSFVLGVAVPILAHRISQLFGLQVGWLPTIIAFVLFGVGAYYVSSRLPSRPWAVALLIYIGVPFGTLTDVMVDWDFFHRDRNFFPFEILSWWMIALGPVIAGVMFGGLDEKDEAETKGDS
jgi:hypothetical protein